MRRKEGVYRRTSYVDAQGKRTTKANGGKRVAAPGFLIVYEDRNGKRRTRSVNAENRAEAVAVWHEMERRERRIREKVDDADVIDSREADKRPLADHVADWRADVSRGRATDKHAKLLETRVLHVFKGCGFQRLSEIKAEAVERFVDGLRRTAQTKPRIKDLGPATAQTKQHYVRALRQVSRWFHETKRTRTHVLGKLEGFERSEIQRDAKHERCDLTDDELARLIRAAENGKRRLGMRGKDRAMAYRIAIGTGFRANEIRSLRRDSFALDGNPPTITVASSYTKNGKRAEQPINPSLAAILAPWLNDRLANGPVLPLPRKTASMMRYDLKIAGIDYRDDAGRVKDFHSLRHSYVTRVVMSGASVAVCKELARHSDVSLTIDRYTTVRLADMAGPVLSLSAFADVAEENLLRKTGTDESAFCAAIRYPLGHDRTPLCTDGQQGTPIGNDDDGSLGGIEETPENIGFPVQECHSMSLEMTQPPVGFEPTTCGLQNRCSAN